MANLYVGSDGVIHSGTGNGVQGAVSVNTGNSSVGSIPASRTSSYSHSYAKANYVSEGRKALFWIFSIAVGILIGLGLYDLVGASIFAQCDAEITTEEVQNWFWSLAPWLFVIGGCAGSICYGIFCAEDRNYDLGAFILSALSALGGIVAGAIALAVVCLVVIIVMYIIGFVIVLAILGAIIAGLCES